MGVKRQLFLKTESQLINGENKQGNSSTIRETAAPSGKHHNNICCRQDPLMNTKIRGQKFQDKQDLHNLQARSTRYFFTEKGKDNK